jgi:hypothetical protein
MATNVRYLSEYIISQSTKTHMSDLHKHDESNPKALHVKKEKGQTRELRIECVCDSGGTVERACFFVGDILRNWIGIEVRRN